jgi:ATP-dependent RNA helicase DeaD
MPQPPDEPVTGPEPAGETPGASPGISIDDLDPDVRRGCADLGWTKLVAVQAMTIGAFRAGRDLMVQSRTGSGKTGAFGIPIIEMIKPEGRYVQAMVLTPTRELTLQVCKEIAAIGKHRGVVPLAIYGGVGYKAQLDGLKEGAQVVVGTAGRILDHMESGALDTSRVGILVLDEADELLSMGFYPDMRRIAAEIPKNRQTLLFSATLPPTVQSLARGFLREPEFISLSTDRRSVEEIENFYYITPQAEKETNLARILQFENPDSAIIFCNTKSEVHMVTATLKRRGFDADEISGDLAQKDRERVMGRIKAGALRFLVATDVAARGIDISDLAWVINYAMPPSPEVYLHRTGRTGRMGKTGIAVSLVSGFDIGAFDLAMKSNRIQAIERELPTEQSVLARIMERTEAAIERDLRELSRGDREKVDQFLPAARELAESEEGREAIAYLLHAYYERLNALPPPEPAVEEALEAALPKDEPPRSGSGSGDGGRRRRRRRR